MVGGGGWSLGKKLKNEDSWKNKWGGGEKEKIKEREGKQERIFRRKKYKGK